VYFVVHLIGRCEDYVSAGNGARTGSPLPSLIGFSLATLTCLCTGGSFYQLTFTGIRV
jgi:amino acid transporter